MITKDVTAHKTGKRHMRALAKIHDTHAIELDSDQFEREEGNVRDPDVNVANVQIASMGTSVLLYNPLSNTVSYSPALSMVEGFAQDPNFNVTNVQLALLATPVLLYNLQSPIVNYPPAPSVVEGFAQELLEENRAIQEIQEPTMMDVPSKSPSATKKRKKERTPKASREHVRPPTSFVLSGKADPLTAFFCHYPPFRYNPYRGSQDEYRRLCTFMGWPSRKAQSKHDQRDEAWENFRIAMVETFNHTFGHDENDMEAWGRLCVLVGMDRIPKALEGRREVRLLCSIIDGQSFTFVSFQSFPRASLS